MNDITPFPRRRAPGRQGGKEVQRLFAFAPRDGNKYPSESSIIRNDRMPTPDSQLASWTWALHYAGTHDLWIVVPIQGSDDDERRADKKSMRAGIWRTGLKNGYDLTSEYVDGNLYIRVVQ